MNCDNEDSHDAVPSSSRRCFEDVKPYTAHSKVGPLDSTLVYCQHNCLLLLFFVCDDESIFFFAHDNQLSFMPVVGSRTPFFLFYIVVSEFNRADDRLLQAESERQSLCLLSLIHRSVSESIPLGSGPLFLSSKSPPVC